MLKKKNLHRKGRGERKGIQNGAGFNNQMKCFAPFAIFGAPGSLADLMI